MAQKKRTVKYNTKAVKKTRKFTTASQTYRKAEARALVHAHRVRNKVEPTYYEQHCPDDRELVIPELIYDTKKHRLIRKRTITDAVLSNRPY